jgi:acetyl-CoA carboxylase biotin carboxylase subunit
MFKRILIANRGEPAVRVIRTCRELGIEAVVVYSEIDAEALPVKLADRAVCIGPAPERDSYRNVPRILSAAEITGCEAVHPAYHFLAENSEFAEAVESCNLRWIGPKSDTMREMSDRLYARRLAAELGIPVLEGSPGEVPSPADARRLAAELGYPVVLKPVRRSRMLWIVRKDRDLDSTLRLAQAEARAGLNDGRIYLERYLPEARHIEIQVLCSRDGQVAQLFERECSIQHRHEKIAVEAPSPLVTEAVRTQLGDWAVRMFRALKYENAGTLELLSDAKGNFYFLDVHASLQSAHPVTEVLLGCDLVAEQIRIAAGQSFSTEFSSALSDRLPPEAPHVIYCRINAEDPDREFMPTAGVVKSLRFPGGPGVRVDSHVYAGYQGSAIYDTLLAKIIVWDANRECAIARMERALRETAVEGVATTLEFQRKVLRLSAFRKGELSVNLVDREILGQ